jgi:acyl-CoA thioester hydrolase
MPSSSTSAAADRFAHPLVVQDADIDANGHVNNVVYLRWVQEAAVAHWSAVVEPDVAAALSWVVVRHEIDYQKPAFRGEALVATTWLGEITAATTERFCTITRQADGEVLSKARTIWCAVDPVSGRPKRIPPQVRTYFFGRGASHTDASAGGTLLP